MMIKAGNLPRLIDFLDGMNLGGRPSLGRTKVRDLMIEENLKIFKDQKRIIEEYDAWSNKEKTKFELVNKEMEEAINDLLNQDVLIEINSPFVDDFRKSLDTYEEKMTGKDADSFYILYEFLIDEENR